MNRRRRRKYIGYYPAGRHHRTRQFPSIVKALALLSIVATAGLWLTCQQFQQARGWQSQRLVMPGQDSAPDSPIFDSQVSLPSDPNAAGRVVYPYSVIPGGVRDTRELRQAMTDPVVAAHYRDFQISRAHIVTLPHDERYYVSYRRGSEVFWTKNKLRVAEGEALMTDGTNYARARCGNRLSPTAQSKTAPNEPSPEELNTPVNLASRSAVPLAVRSAAPSLSAPVPQAAAAVPAELVPPGPPPEVPTFAFTFPVVPPNIVPPVPPTKKPNKCPPGSVSPNPPCKKRPPSPVPEPGTWWLMSAGAATLLLHRSLRLRDRAGKSSA